MKLRQSITGLAVGSLLLGGAVVAHPFSGAAQNAATPSAQTDQNGDGETVDATPVIGTPIFTPAIDLKTAQETALTGQTGAAVSEISLDGSDGVLAYSIQLDNGVEVKIDATSGKVLETGQANDENQGADEGNQGADEGNQGADEGNQGADEGNQGADEGNQGADEGNQGADENSNEDSGTPVDSNQQESENGD